MFGKRLKLCILCAVFGVSTGSLYAAEVNVCYAEQGNANPMYMDLATTQTRFICFGTDKRFRPTFNELYENGWRLAQIVDGKAFKNQKGVQVRVPLYYFERDKKPRNARF
jgi:hypothetical protein